jgi:hypothetical protein
MVTYRSRQFGWILIGLADVLVVVAFVLGVFVGGALALTGLVLFIASLLLTFTAILTVTVDDEHLTAAFTLGWPVYRVPIAEITDAEAVRNAAWWGLGIRRVPGGVWMYNVGGLDAVEITRGDGQRFRIGTNDPRGLLAAIDTARRA